MKSKWKISSQYFDGVKEFQVYRLRDIDRVDHSGNREYRGGIFESRDDAVRYANQLNNEH